MQWGKDHGRVDWVPGSQDIYEEYKFNSLLLNEELLLQQSFSLFYLAQIIVIDTVTPPRGGGGPRQGQGQADNQERQHPPDNWVVCVISQYLLFMHFYILQIVFSLSVLFLIELSKCILFLFILGSVRNTRCHIVTMCVCHWTFIFLPQPGLSQVSGLSLVWLRSL